jgi:hypothetical protein
MPHSFFIDNAFIGVDGENSEGGGSVTDFESSLQYADKLGFFEKLYISKLPYWFTRRCVVVLEKI